MKLTEAIENIENLLARRRWILEQLEFFEKKYHMSAREFINAWKKGSLPEPEDPDTHGDFIVWEGLYDELVKVEKELKKRIID